MVFIGSSPFDVPPPAAPPTPPPAPEPPAPPPAPEPHVQFGFADGSTMTLSDDDPRAKLLREMASRLTGTEVT